MSNPVNTITQSLAALLSSNRSIKNVIWNLIGGVWTGVLILAATPWYVSRLGLDGYGIVGLWLMMQVMMGLLDIGMGATLVKEFAASTKDLNSLEIKRDLLRTLEIVYWLIAVLLAMILFFAAGWVGDHWLKSNTLPSAFVANTIRIMAIALGFQFPFTLYLNGLAGLQEHGQMNVLQIIWNALRYGSGAAILFWKADLVSFFIVQILVATMQTLVTRMVVWRMISEAGARVPAFNWEILQRIWRFSTGMALTAVSAVFLANADRLVLSKMASTEELGKYAVAFTASGILQMGIQPFYRAFFPRYSELVSSGDDKRLNYEYFRSCRLMAIVIIPLGIIGWLFAPNIFYVWLHKFDNTTIDVFRWLLIGVSCSGLMWLPAAFQQAHGWTRLHATMISGALLLGTPLMVLAINAYGTVGATTVWVLHGLSDITLGLWLMHRRMLVGELLYWYRSVLLLPILFSLPLSLLSFFLMPQGLNKWFIMSWIVVTGFIVILLPMLFFFINDRKNVLPLTVDFSGE